MSKKVQENKRETWHPFRSLSNYKAMHLSLAKRQDKTAQFEAATTLTAARRILFGR